PPSETRCGRIESFVKSSRGLPGLVLRALSCRTRRTRPARTINPPATTMTSNGLKQALAAARAEVAKVIIGQSQVVDRCLIAIITGQHALIEGVPGVAKTLLVRTLARVLGCSFARIQFNPDLMPADITGTNVF